MPISTSATLVRADARTVTATRPQVATLSHGTPVTITGYVHTTSESSPFLRTFAGTAATVATLARAVTRTLTVSNPPAAVLNNQAKPILLATQGQTATLTALKAHFVNVSATAVTVATHVRAKLVTLVSGFLNALPPSWVSVGQAASVVSRRTPSLLATQTQTATTTKGISYHLQTAAGTTASVTRAAVAKLTNLLATPTTVATLAQMPLKTFTAQQNHVAQTKIAYPRKVTATVAEQAFLAWLFLPSVTPVLNPLPSGGLTLTPTSEGLAAFPGVLYPGTFVFPGLGLQLVVSTTGTLTLGPL